MTIQNEINRNPLVFFEESPRKRTLEAVKSREPSDSQKPPELLKRSTQLQIHDTLLDQAPFSPGQRQFSRTRTYVILLLPTYEIFIIFAFISAYSFVATQIYYSLIERRGKSHYAAGASIAVSARLRFIKVVAVASSAHEAKDSEVPTVMY